MADRLDLGPNIRFGTEVTAATFEESAGRWVVHTDDGDTVTARFVIAAVGGLSEPYVPDFEGIGEFEGFSTHPARWPEEPGIDIAGRGGRSLAEKWADGPRTYLGLAVRGFPNLFTVTGPQSPSLLSNVPVPIEHHVRWISDAVEHLTETGLRLIEPTERAEEA